jgi:outer membrane protein, heavy metal efflux system
MFSSQRHFACQAHRGNRSCAWLALLPAMAVCVAALGAEGSTDGADAAAKHSSPVIQAAFDRLPPVTDEEVPAPLAAGDAEPLTLADLEQMALGNNPSLPVAGANVDAARGRTVQAGLYPNPVIGYMGNEIGDDGTAGMQGGFVSQEFVTGGKLRLDQAKAAQKVRETQFQFDAQQLRVVNDVRLRFYSSLVAQRQVELTDELVRISKQLVQFSQRLLAAQQLSKNDVLLSEIESSESEILADNAHNQETEAWRRLAAVVGATELEPRPLAGELDAEIPDYTWEDSYARAVALNPELSAAEARVRRARIAIERERQQNVPNIDVMLSALHKNTNHDDVAGVQVGFPLPILDRNQGNIFAAEAELIEAQNNVRRLELDLQDRLAMALRRYANARQQADRYKQEILPRAKQSLDLVTRGYASGQVDFLTQLTSQRTYIRVNLAYLGTLDELWQAATLIDGQLLSGSLQGDNSM